MASSLICPVPIACEGRTIVVAGGQALVRAVRFSVLSRAGLDVVANEIDAAGAAEAAEFHGAALVLVDSAIAGGCVRAIRRITARAPETAVLVVAPELDREAVLASVRSGAVGFVPETLGASGLIRAVEVALSGESVIPRAAVGTLIEQLHDRAQDSSEDGRPLQLTRREADVLARSRQGMTPKEIASELELSDITVRRHLSSVARKRRQARPLTLALESSS